MGKVWWVNQNKNVGGAFNDLVWAPKEGDGGRKLAHWDRLAEVDYNDVIFHYTAKHVVGYSVAEGKAIDAPRPAEYGDGPDWAKDDGRQLQINYKPLERPIYIDEIPMELRKANKGPVGPFVKGGTVAQGYMYPVSAGLYRKLMELSGLRADLTDHVRPKERDAAEPTDAVARVLRRLEQGALKRKLVAGRSTAPCGLCGQDTAVEYLVAAHIKPRADCTQAERNDFDNVAMLACLFGCDRAFEIGGLRVDSSGRMVVDRKLAAQRPEWAALVDGEVAAAFHDGNRSYFKDRLKSF